MFLWPHEPGWFGFLVVITWPVPIAALPFALRRDGERALLIAAVSCLVVFGIALALTLPLRGSGGTICAVAAWVSFLAGAACSIALAVEHNAAAKRAWLASRGKYDHDRSDAERRVLAELGSRGFRRLRRRGRWFMLRRAARTLLLAPLAVGAAVLSSDQVEPATSDEAPHSVHTWATVSIVLVVIGSVAYLLYVIYRNCVDHPWLVVGTVVGLTHAADELGASAVTELEFEALQIDVQKVLVLRAGRQELLPAERGEHALFGSRRRRRSLSPGEPVVLLAAPGYRMITRLSAVIPCVADK